MFPPVVVDTNVVVAGLLTTRADSPVAGVLDGMLAAAFPFAVSEALLAEYWAVLRRPSLRKAHGLTLNELDIIVVELAQHGIVLAPVPYPAVRPGSKPDVKERATCAGRSVMILGEPQSIPTLSPGSVGFL